MVNKIAKSTLNIAGIRDFLFELLSVIDLGFVGPAISNTADTGQLDYTGATWFVDLYGSYSYYQLKTAQLPRLAH